MFIYYFKVFKIYFPSENQSTYFIPYFKEGGIVSVNRDKLFDKYCNIKRKILKINPLNKRKYVDEPQLNFNDVITDDVSRTGIKELCVWNEVESFDVTSNYSVDIMHNMLEGVCKYDIGFLLKELIYNLKYFSVDTLNERIESFNHGPTDIRKRPTLTTEMNIKRPGCLKMSASKMLCFMK